MMMLASWCLLVLASAVAERPALERLVERAPKAITRYTRSRDQAAAAAAAAESLTALPVSVAVMVTLREQILGCHSFAQFLDPRWETYYVFPEWYASEWRLRDLVTSPPVATKGAHLMEVGRAPPGDIPARAMVLAHLAGSLPELFYSTECCIQSLPEFHAQSVPFGGMLETLVFEFVSESTARREAPGGGRTEKLGEKASVWAGAELPCDPGVDVPAVDRRPLLSMTPVIVETLPFTQTVAGALIHGVDVGQWQSRRGQRPSNYSRDTTPGPWLADTTAWLEDHAVLYNSSLLVEFLADDILAMGDVQHNFVRYGPPLVCRKGWAASRHNELYVWFDRDRAELRSKFPNGTMVSVFDEAKYAAVSYEEIQFKNLELYEWMWSPLSCYQHYLNVKKVLNLSVAVWCAYPELHLHNHHMAIPDWLLREEANDKFFGIHLDRYDEAAGHLANEANRLVRLSASPRFSALVKVLLSFAGYVPMEENRGGGVVVKRFVQLPLFDSRRVVTTADEEANYNATVPKKRHAFQLFAQVEEESSQLVMKTSWGTIKPTVVDLLRDGTYVPHVVPINLDANLNLLRPPWPHLDPTSTPRWDPVAGKDLTCHLCALYHHAPASLPPDGLLVRRFILDRIFGDDAASHCTVCSSSP